MQNALYEIAKAGCGLKYYVSFSYVLKHLGLIDTAHDIDIIIDIDDFDDFISNLKYDTVNETPESKVYLSDKFLNVSIMGVDVDIISNYNINYNGLYEYKFNYDRVTDYIKTPCGNIPIIPLDDLCNLYKVMPKKNNNFELLNEYLNLHK